LLEPGFFDVALFELPGFGAQELLPGTTAAPPKSEEGIADIDGCGAKAPRLFESSFVLIFVNGRWVWRRVLFYRA
jgi:hypothetical protein